MMPKWGLRETLMTVGAVILLCTIVWFVSAKNQRQKDQLAENHTKITLSDKHTDSVQIRTDSSKAITAKLDSTHDIVRRKIKVVHDTITVECNPSVTSAECNPTVTISPEIAQLIIRDDSLISALKGSLALQDTLIASLRVGLNLRDQRIKLLESRGTTRFSKGFQVGVGYCQAANSRTPCIYAGYGFQLRIP